MALDFTQLQAAATAAAAKRHFTLDEGETLILLVPFPDGWAPGRPNGMPWVEQELLSGDAYKFFKRPVMSISQPYCETDSFKRAAERAGKTDDPDVALALVDSGKMDDASVKAAKAYQSAWVVCRIADRRRDSDPWSKAYERPQIARFKRGNDTKPCPQKFIEKALSKGAGKAMMGELSDYIVAAQSGADVSGAKVHARLFRLGRTGKTQNATVYTGGLASEADGEDFVNYEIPQAMLEDILRGICEGGEVNIHDYTAEATVPSLAEIASKLYGEGGEAAVSRPSMDEA